MGRGDQILFWEDVWVEDGIPLKDQFPERQKLMKPFRVLDSWLNQKGYQRMVKETWSKDQQGGWGGIVLKNKLRNLKNIIKQWSKVNADINVSKIQRLRQQLNDLEITAADRPLSQDEVKVKKSIQQELWEVSNVYESMLRQKSREKWIKEGDSNTTYFHKVLNCRRNYNALQGLFIDGNWVQQPDRVKDEVLNFFLHRFNEVKMFRPTLDGDCLKRCMDLIKKGASIFFFPEGTRSKDGRLGTFKSGRDKAWHSHWWKDLRRLYNQPDFHSIHQNMNPCRPTLDGIQFSSLGQGQKESLGARFSEVEIKSAVWACGGDKSPGPDGLNFNFSSFGKF
ncbi:1-acyl-sn-glycerol-3-phosphate acyltransferase 1, chloroplastic [Glycine max]|nr:1-acyl-sn-glycerol-3-phosphate acyltransferase 1, chloroplastic [Glycine max]